MAFRQIQIWLEGNTSIARTIPFNRSSLAGLFVTTMEDIYIHAGQPTGRIEKWPLNATNSIIVMNVSAVCFGLFITTNGTLYCSFGFTGHSVIRTTLANTMITTAVAGNGSPGSSPNRLTYPYGIFVDVDFTLYVADFGNNRIQRFLPGQLNGTTVAGAGAAAPGNITLAQPNFITLDGDGYLYILEYGSGRLIGSGPNGFRCVAACTNTPGVASDQLITPANFAFDSHGNIFISDMGNSRIQQFIMVTNSCGKHSQMYGPTTSVRSERKY